MYFNFIIYICTLTFKFNLVDGHPLLEELDRSELKINQIDALEKSLESRASSLDKTIVTLTDLDDYSNRALVPILETICEIDSKTMTSPDLSTSLAYLGRAQMIIRRLKGIGASLRMSTLNKNQVAKLFIPAKLLLNEDLGINENLLKEIMHEMASHAHSHLSQVEPVNKFVKLSRYTTFRYLDELRRCEYNILKDSLQIIGSKRDGTLPVKVFIKSFL